MRPCENQWEEKWRVEPCKVWHCHATRSHFVIVYQDIFSWLPPKGVEWCHWTIVTFHYPLLWCTLHLGCEIMDPFLVSSDYPVKQVFPLVWQRHMKSKPVATRFHLCSTYNNFGIHNFFSSWGKLGWFWWLFHVTEDCKPHRRSITQFQQPLCVHFSRLKLALYWSNLRWSHSVILGAVHPQFLYDHSGTHYTIP